NRAARAEVVPPHATRQTRCQPDATANARRGDGRRLPSARRQSRCAPPDCGSPAADRSGGGLARALGNGELGFAERLATTRESFDGARAGAIGHAQHVRGKLAAIAWCLPKCKRSVLLLGPQHSEASRRASKLAQRGRERIAFAVVEAVGKPDHAE